RARDCLGVTSRVSLGLPTAHEDARLLLVSLAEGLAEERAEAVVGIARHFLEDVAIKLPVALLRRSAQEAAALRVALELLLERIGVEGSEHGFIPRAQPGEHRHLMDPQIVERPLEGLDRLEVRRVVSHEEVVQRILGVGREFDRVVLAPPVSGDLETKLILQLLARSQHYAQSVADPFMVWGE